MKIEKIKVSDLKPYENNAKIHTKEQVEQIKQSILEFGFNDPIAVDENNMIVEGHGRLLAVKALGYTEVDCIRLDGMTDEQKRAYIHVHNQLTLNTGFDLGILEAELKSIENIDMGVFGFDMDFDIDTDFDVEATEDDFEAEVPEEPNAKLGDIYQLGRHRLMCGDSTSIKDVEKLMGGEKATMGFTDPPWNVNYGALKEDNAQGYKPRTILNDFMGTEDFKEFMNKAFASLNFSMKDGAMTYVVMSAHEWGNMMLTLASNDFHCSSTIIWNKDSLVLSRKDYHTKYEPICVRLKIENRATCGIFRDRKRARNTQR